MFCVIISTSFKLMNVENYGKRQIKYINLILICRKIHDIILFLNFG